MGTRKTIIAIHGAGMTAGVWGGLAPHLLDHSFRPLTLPGHDPKTGTALLQDISAMAAWVKEKIAGHPQDVVLVGHSMGALVALAAAEAPSVVGIGLLGAALKMPVHPDLLKSAKETPNDAIGLIIKWSVNPAHPQVGAVRTVLGSLMHAANPAAVGCDLAACDNFFDGAMYAGAVQKPTLVLSAEQDKMAKAVEGEALSKAIAGSDYKTLKDCGHMMMVEKPIDTAQALRDFISARLSQ